MSLRHVPEIAELVGEFKSKRLLAYGCGEGLDYRRERVHVVWGVEMPVLYDPVIAPYNVKPSGQFDGVICVGALDDMDENAIRQAVSDIAFYARQWAFIAVHGAGWQVRLSPFFGKGVRLVVVESWRPGSAELNEVHERTYGRNIA